MSTNHDDPTQREGAAASKPPAICGCGKPWAECDCEHSIVEDCMTCRECGECREDLDADDTCGDCHPDQMVA